MMEIKIPEKWELKTLGQIAKVKGGKRLPTGHNFVNYKTEHPYLSVKDLKKNTVSENGIQYLADSTWEKIQNYTISKDDVYITIAGTIGEVGIIPEKWDKSNLTENAAKICDFTVVTKEFLCLVIRSPLVQKQIKERISQVGVSKFGLYKIRDLIIPIPSLETQKKIVDKLDYIFEKLNEKKKSLLLLKEIQKSRLNYLEKNFVDNIIDDVFQLQKPVKSWEKLTIDEAVEKQLIVDFQDGNHGELHPKKSDFSDSGRPFITAKQIDDKGNIHLEECKKLPEVFCKKLRIGFSEPNDVLFTHNATVGRVAILPKNAPSSIVGTSVTYYRLNPQRIFNKFFFYLLRSRFIRNQYIPIMKQSTRNQFSKLKQAKLNLLIPPLDEQKELVKKLTALFDNMRDMSPALKNLIEKQTKLENEIMNIQNSILNDAFSGKLVN